MANYSRIAGQSLSIQAASATSDARIGGISLQVQAASATSDERIGGMSFQIQAASQENDQRNAGLSLQIFAIGPLIALVNEGSYLQGVISAVTQQLQGTQSQLQGGALSAELDLDVCT
jgi:hypothetical protein